MRYTDSIFNRLIEIGFEPGSCNSDVWAVTQLEKLTERVNFLEAKLTSILNDSEHPDEILDNLQEIMIEYKKIKKDQK